MTEASIPPPAAPAGGRATEKHWLLTGRWLSLLLLAVLAVPGCIELGRWQLHRLHHAQADNRLIRDNSRAAAQPVDQLTSVGGAVPKDRRWRTVEVRGTYDAGHTLLVRNRGRGGDPGFQVLTPVVTDDGTAALVDRGWLAIPQGVDVPDVPAPPSGRVVVTGLLRPTETQPSRGPHDGPDVPAGQVVRIDIPRISGGLPYPVYAGYVDLRTQDPPAPVVDGGLGAGPEPAVGLRDRDVAPGLRVAVVRLRRDRPAGIPAADPPGGGRPTVRARSASAGRDHEFRKHPADASTQQRRGRRLMRHRGHSRHHQAGSVSHRAIAPARGRLHGARNGQDWTSARSGTAGVPQRSVSA